MPDQPQLATDPQPAARPPLTRARKELVIAAVCLGLGFIVLPIGIYLVGSSVLGPYGGGPHIGSFFGDFFRNLLRGVGRTWFIVLSPYLAFWVLRLIFFRWGAPSTDASGSAPKAEVAHGSRAQERREPFVAP